MMLDFYGENMVRFFQDNAGGIVRDPEAVPPAQILVDRPRLNPGTLQLEDEQGKITVRTPLIAVEIDKQSGLFIWPVEKPWWKKPRRFSLPASR